jgi:hypothetical protein
MQGDARVLGATSRRRRAENPAAKSRSGAALMTAQPVVLGPGQERQFWTSVSHGTVKVESGTTCPPTTGRWYGKSGDQLRAARPDQAPLRPGQHLPAQPQHRPRAVAQASHPRPRRTGHRAGPEPRRPVASRRNSIVPASRADPAMYPAARPIRLHALTGSRGAMSIGLGVVLAASSCTAFRSAVL